MDIKISLYNMKLRKTFGFTLLELLVVIAVVGLLATVILISLQGSKAKGRDAKRLEDMQSIRNAMNLYVNENNGSYPTSGVYDEGNQTYIDTAPYIRGTAVDPLNTAMHYYVFDSLFECNGSTFPALIATTMEVTGRGNLFDVCSVSRSFSGPGAGSALDGGADNADLSADSFILRY